MDHLIAEIEAELEQAGVPLIVGQRQAAEALGLSPRTVQRWTASGVLPSAMPRGSRRALVRRRELARLLAETRQPQAATV